MAADIPSAARQPISTRRIEAFTDGVFSIAATLLVLDLTVDGFAKATTNDQLWNELLGLQQNLLSFVISFLLLCFLWSIHVRQFEYVERVDRTLTALNTLRLLGVVLIPFTTSLNSGYSELLVGRLALPINFLFVVAMGVVQWEYATGSKRGLVEGLPEETRRRYRANGFIAVVLGALVVALAAFVGPWAFLVYLLSAFFQRVVNNPGRRARAADDEAADR
jgi:uncharacterized membrane protein